MQAGRHGRKGYKLDDATVAGIRVVLGDRPVLHLATVKANGAPHVTPVWASFDGQKFYVSVAGAQKRTNLARDARVALSVTAEGPTLPHLIVEGSAVPRYDEEALKIWRDLIVGYIGEAGLVKYLAPPILAPGKRTLIEVTPTKIILRGLA